MREASISEQLQRRSIVLVESSLPPHLTLAEWRRGQLVPRSRRQAGVAAIRHALQRLHPRAVLE